MRTITVTDVDIRAGIRYNNESCPLALAMNRAFDEKIKVGLSEWWHTGDDYHPLPAEAVAFRQLFDDKKKVHPFQFQVEV